MTLKTDNCFFYFLAVLTISAWAENLSEYAHVKPVVTTGRTGVKNSGRERR